MGRGFSRDIKNRRAAPLLSAAFSPSLCDVSSSTLARPSQRQRPSIFVGRGFSRDIKNRRAAPFLSAAFSPSLCDHTPVAPDPPPREFQLPTPSSSTSGKVKRNRVPFPPRKGLSQAIVPPISSILRATIESPNPVPVAFVVK